MSLKIYAHEVAKLWKRREVKEPSKYFAFNKNDIIFFVSKDNTTIVSLVSDDGKSFQVPKKYLQDYDPYTYFINTPSTDDLLMSSCRGPLNKCDEIAYEIYLKIKSIILA